MKAGLFCPFQNTEKPQGPFYGCCVGVKLEDFEEKIKESEKTECSTGKLTQHSSTKSAQKELNVVSHKQFSLWCCFCVTNSNSLCKRITCVLQVPYCPTSFCWLVFKGEGWCGVGPVLGGELLGNLDPVTNLQARTVLLGPVGQAAPRGPRVGRWRVCDGLG